MEGFMEEDKLSSRQVLAVAVVTLSREPMDRESDVLSAEILEADMRG
jgi:hypothetical protein